MALTSTTSTGSDHLDVRLVGAMATPIRTAPAKLLRAEGDLPERRNLKGQPRLLNDKSGCVSSQLRKIPVPGQRSQVLNPVPSAGLERDISLSSVSLS